MLFLQEYLFAISIFKLHFSGNRQFLNLISNAKINIFKHIINKNVFFLNGFYLVEFHLFDFYVLIWNPYFLIWFTKYYSITSSIPSFANSSFAFARTLELGGEKSLFGFIVLPDLLFLILSSFSVSEKTKFKSKN